MPAFPIVLGDRIRQKGYSVCRVKAIMRQPSVKSARPENARFWYFADWPQKQAKSTLKTVPKLIPKSKFQKLPLKLSFGVNFIPQKLSQEVQFVRRSKICVLFYVS